MQKNLKAAILAALLAAPAVSFAQEAEESNFSWNAGVVSDYVFRGVSQSGKDIAFQGGVDYAFGDSGFYAGVWGSNIDFGYKAAPDLEVDGYVGFNTDLGEKFNFDIMLTRYTYHGDDNDGNIDYNELITKFAMADVATLTVGYTNDYSNTGENVTYVNLGNSWDLGKDFSLNAGFGRTFSDFGDYNDWNVGVSKSFGGLEFGLNYYDTNLNFNASDSVVLSVKIGG
jgi:uncharacterized protein (TIGR02001 family)